MEIAKQMAGFSPAEADDLRKAVGKKKRDLMATMQDEFLAGLEASGTERSVAKDLWSLMEAAADYSFNRSHAACYALIAYRTAWLRANYPAEYMAALISSVMSTKDKVPFFVNRCDEMGIEVLPPDVNASDHGFVVSRQEHPLRARRRQERRPRGRAGDHRGARGGRRVHLDLRLLRAGRHPRGQQARDRVPGQVRRPRLDRRDPPRDARGAAEGDRRRPEGAGGLAPAARARSSTSAAAGGAAGPRGARPAPADRPRRVRPARAAAPREGDARDLPLLAPAGRGPRRAARAGRLLALRARRARRTARSSRVGGIVTEFKRHKTKRGDPMVFATLDDIEGQVEMLVLGKAYAESVECSGSTASWSSGAASTTRSAARRS